MFYLAILCIVLGLLCLLYLGFTLSGRGEGKGAVAAQAPGSFPKAAQAPFRPTPASAPQPAAPSHHQGPATQPASAAREPAGVYREQPMPRETMSRESMSWESAPGQPAAPTRAPAAPAQPPANRPEGIPRPGEAPRREVRSEQHEPRERITEFRRIDTDALADTLRVYSRREAPTRQAEPPLIVGGVLYLNNSRYLPTAVGQAPGGDADFAPRAFANLRRVGQGTLVLEGGGFHIHCGNANYSYTVSDLEQIVFQERGVALIPTRHDHAVPVFITEDPERIKNYIKKHAHIIHGRP